MNRLVLNLSLCVLLVGSTVAQSTDTLPASLDDRTFWRFVTGGSEPDGTFRYENLLSNEASYQQVIPTLQKLEPVSAYVGVGPEQNFTYISALEPKIAFIVDIRRQNMLELLLYKALFETSKNRVEFVSQLFSRQRPSAVGSQATASELFAAFDSSDCDTALLGETERRVEQILTKDHGFMLTAEDIGIIRHVLETFGKAGPQIDYGFVNAPSNLTAPSYKELMTATDGHGQNWSYLASEDNFARVRNMQRKNLIIPLTGDFAGQRTLRWVGAYLKMNRASVTAFYVSNVEQYLNPAQSAQFRTNVSMLPVTPSSALIRFMPPESTVLIHVRDFLQRSGKLFHLLTGH